MHLVAGSSPSWVILPLHWKDKSKEFKQGSDGWPCELPRWALDSHHLKKNFVARRDSPFYTSHQSLPRHCPRPAPVRNEGGTAQRGGNKGQLRSGLVEKLAPSPLDQQISLQKHGAIWRNFNTEAQEWYHRWGCQVGAISIAPETGEKWDLWYQTLPIRAYCQHLWDLWHYQTCSDLAHQVASKTKAKMTCSGGWLEPCDQELWL